MSNLIEIGGVIVHTDAAGRYSLNDLHKAAGGERKDEPSEYLSGSKVQEIVTELETTGIPVVKKEGRNGGTYVCKELVYSYAMWISAKFHLQVIRTFDALVSSGQNETISEVDYVQKSKSMKSYFSVAKLIGLKGNQAVLSANRLAKKIDGVDWLDLLGATHLIAADQVRHLTPTELGAKIGLSGQKLNTELDKASLQVSIRNAKGIVTHSPTAKGMQYAVLLDTGKNHGDGTPVQQLKWLETVLDELKQEEGI